MLPPPSAGSTPTSPPSRSTICLTMLRPRPVPPFCRASVASTCTNFSNTRSRYSSGMPVPWSRTVMRVVVPSFSMPTTTSPPRGENLTALDRRLMTTCVIRSGSTRTVASCEAGSSRTVTPKFSANPLLASIACSASALSSIGSSANTTLPDSIFSISRMSLIKRTSRWLLLWAMARSRLAGSGNGPAAPPASSPSEPAIEVIGVRNSWLTVATNSSFMRSWRLRVVMSRTNTTNMRRSPIGMSAISKLTGNTVLSDRWPSSSRTSSSSAAMRRSCVPEPTSLGPPRSTSRPMSRRDTSSAVTPNIRSAAGLRVSMLPLSFSVMMPIMAELKMAC